MKSRTRYTGIGRIALLEKTFCIFRSGSPQTLGAYYLGSMPFVLGFLYFQADMSRSPFAAAHCAAASLGLALLFIWMKYWQAVFLMRIQARLYRRPAVKLTISGICRLVFIQVIVQPSGLFMLPLSATVLFPFAWVYAFYQNALTWPPDQPFKLRAFLRQSWQKAAWQPVQNHFLLLFYSLFSVFVMLNVCAGLMLLPSLMKTFLDIETRFSMSAYSMLNTTFLFTAMGITYLCADPLVKISYALRGMQASWVDTGDDLKAEFVFLTKQRTKQAKGSLLTGIVLFAVLGGANLSPARAQQVDNNAAITRGALDQSIDAVMARPEFTWRMPREQPGRDQEGHGFVKAVMAWLESQIKRAAGLLKYTETFFKWLKDLLGGFDFETKDKKSLPDMRALFIVLSIGLACFLMIWGMGKIVSGKNRHDPPDNMDARQVIPDLADEDVQADQLPSDRWFSMAETLTAKGDFKMALRAFYLCTLAFLGESHLISIARYKSNFDYDRELCRRAHGKKDLLGLFKQNMLIFEKTWYGTARVDRGDVVRFRENHGKIVSFAK